MTDTAAPPLWAAPRAHEPVDATVELPGSKSLANRELVLAAIAEGPGVVSRALRSRDTELMAAALTSLGSVVDTSGPDWRVTPGIVRTPADPVAVDCGLAGTVMRFVPPVAALRASPVAFDGDPHARSRPMAAVLTALRSLGVRLDGEQDRLPFTVLGAGSVRGGEVVIDASASSQFLSALLLAAPAYELGVDIRHDGKPIPSVPHVEMTLACLRARGVEVDDSDVDRWRVLPGPVAARDVTIEPDLSNAAPFLMLAMTSGGTVRVPGWPFSTTQAGDALRAILAEMGAEVVRTPEGLQVTGGGRIRPLVADLHAVGELTPVLAAVCALADGRSELTGIGPLR
ncbi:MAG: 3-phosphoshikimate 1-carboxyvinyltransferase, partial [Marmoricola sp.]